MTITGPVYSRGTSNGANTVKAYTSLGGSKTIGSMVAGSMGYMGSPNEGNIESIAVSVTSGTTVLVAAVPNKIIEVQNYTIDSSGTANVKFLSGSTDITGAMPVVVNQVITNTGVSMKTGVGEALSINLSASAVTGHLSYRLI